MREGQAVPENDPDHPVFELHFSPRALVRSRLCAEAGEVYESGQKGCEVRWQQGAIAVCILVVYTRLAALEGADEAPLLQGERGSPARSIDNVLTKPSDWALNMFGERNQLPRIRDFIYRKKAVSKSNPVSAVQWDVEHFPMDAIRIWREGQELTSAEEVRELLRVLLEEFNPRRAEADWAALFPDPPATPAASGTAPAVETPPVMPVPGATSVPYPGVVPPGQTHPPMATTAPFSSPPFEPPASQRPWLLLLVLFSFLGIGAYFLGRATGPMPQPVEPGTRNAPASESAAVVEEFIELLNARALDEAYALTSQSFREDMSREAFALALGNQRFNFPRIAGNPYRNGADQRVHEYRVTLYVETEVHRIPALEGLARTPVTEIESYARGINQLITELTAAGVDPVYLRQLQKDRLERPDASRYLQLICGLSDADLARLYPEVVTVTLDLTYFFELVRDPAAGGAWRVQTAADAADRIVAF